MSEQRPELQTFASVLRMRMAGAIPPMGVTEVAEAVGVTRQTVGQWTSARSVPDAPKLLKLERILGLEPGELSQYLDPERFPGAPAGFDIRPAELEERRAELEALVDDEQ